MFNKGFVINKLYEIKELIYRSATDNVNIYKVKNLSDNLEYAMKIFDINVLSETDKSVLNEIFHREERALRKIHSDNVVKFFDSGSIENYYFIVMEFLEEYITLYDYVNHNKSFSENKKISITIELLKGMQTCHEHNIVHRDLKPQNVMVNPKDGSIKIIDFGISKVTNTLLEKQSITLKDHMTLNYASPEQVLRGEYTERSDIFSMGCVLFFIFSGEEPPENKENIGFEIGLLGCNKEIKTLIYKMTQDSSEERPSSFSKILDSLMTIKENIEKDNYELNIIITKRTKRDLYNLSKIDGLSDVLATTFIIDSLKVCNLYKGNQGKIYLVGDRISYEVNISTEKEEFIILGAKNIAIDKMDYEHKKGVNINSVIKVYINDRNYTYKTDSSYLEYLIEEIDKDLNKSNEVKFSKNNLNSQLKIWNDYLNHLKEINFKKGEMGIYVSIDYDVSGNFLHIQTQKKLQFEYLEKVQITAKNGKKEIIGEFYDYFDEKIIIVRPNIDFSLERYSSRGLIGVNSYLDSIVTNRYSNAIKDLTSGNSVNKNLINLLNEPNKISLSTDYFIEQTVNEKFLDSTKILVEKALSTNDLFLIQGPPGTGKTTIITEIIAQLYLANPKMKILFVSPSHVAVDHAINNIQKLLKKCILPEQRVEDIILRLGVEEKISYKNGELSFENHTNRWVQSVKKYSLAYFYEHMLKDKIKSDEKRKDIYEILNDDSITNRQFLTNLVEHENQNLEKMSYILKDWYRNLHSNNDFQSLSIDEIFLVASTCTGIASENMKEAAYDWVIIDEAARATAPELLIPLVKGKKAILVGDHKQLPPIVSSDSDEYSLDKGKLEQSLFENLYNKMGTDVKRTLTTQFRMHPAISNMINDLFYFEEKITTYIDKKSYPLEKYYKPITWVDTGVLEKSEEHKKSTSYINYAEADMIVKQLEELDTRAKKLNKKYNVGIISGYGAQTELISNNIKEFLVKFENLEIDVNNVDAFQGSEKDIIFYSVVRSNNNRNIGFLKDERRLNVALSRAKEQLFIVGNIDISKYEPIDENPFSRLLNYITGNPETCQIL
ncbi:AAA domain-containing protein [Lactococcus cremoris]